MKLTTKQEEVLVKKVLVEVRKLKPILVHQYEGTITKWLVRTVLECTELQVLTKIIVDLKKEKNE